MFLSGTAKNVKQQLDSMIMYYGKNELVSNIIANERKCSGGNAENDD